MASKKTISASKKNESIQASVETDRQTTILIIHSQENVREEYAGLLEKKGYQVVSAKDGTEGIIQAYQVIPELVIADVMLPEINGYQLCRLLKNDPVTQKIPFILVSNFDEKIDKFWGFKAGADAFIHHDETRVKLVKQASMLLEIYDRLDTHEKDKLRSEKSNELINIRTRLTQILDKSLIESTLMIEFRNLSDLIHDKNLLNYMLFSLMESILDYEVAAIMYNDKNREPRVFTYNLAESTIISNEQVAELNKELFEELIQRNPEKRKWDNYEFDVIGDAKEEAPKLELKSRYIHEFVVEDNLNGVLVLFSKNDVNYDEVFPVHLIEDEIRLLMKLRYLYSQAENLAITDGMTGLFNYRHFMLSMEREFRRAQRYELDMTIALIDLDNFKSFNDTWGHLLGDEILKVTANIALESFRSIDFVARYGGEELVVILPETDLAAAVVACERFRKALEETRVPWRDTEVSTTVSIGVNQVRQHTESVSELIKGADDALYYAKSRGKNRIEKAR